MGIPQVGKMKNLSTYCVLVLRKKKNHSKCSTANYYRKETKISTVLKESRINYSTIG